MHLCNEENLEDLLIHQMEPTVCRRSGCQFLLLLPALALLRQSQDPQVLTPAASLPSVFESATRAPSCSTLFNTFDFKWLRRQTHMS